MWLDKFNESIDESVSKIGRSASEVWTKIVSGFIWMVVLVAPVTIGAYLGKSLPGWCAPVYGLIVAWLATAFAGNSRYRYVIGAVALVVSWLSWYISRVAPLH